MLQSEVRRRSVCEHQCRPPPSRTHTTHPELLLCCHSTHAAAQQAAHSQQPDPSSSAAFQASHWGALAGLWRQGQLCDVALTAAGGETLAAHSIVLASASGFFRCVCVWWRW
jgi:hypothetical protein